MKGKEEDISIKVNIAGVAFPMRVQPSEEELIRKAESLIGERLKALKEGYQVTDRHTLLSMLTIQLAGDLVQQQELSNTETLSQQFQELNKLLDAALNEI
jgi:cell division protein ZapA (FtsZ GTPase activity inhibitor)